MTYNDIFPTNPTSSLDPIFAYLKKVVDSCIYPFIPSLQNSLKFAKSTLVSHIQITIAKPLNKT